MSGPMMGHRSKAASALQRRISNNLRRILLTEQEILLSTSSGTGLMEGAVRSCTAKRAAIFSVGAFGDKWYKIATGNGVPSDIFKSELGQPTTPEMVDAALSTGKYDTICITHNETSTGIQNPVEEIAEVLKKYPDVVWCMDAVSSAAGSRIETDKLGVDVLVTSTQKALALPPGMAVCTLSQKRTNAPPPFPTAAATLTCVPFTTPSRRRTTSTRTLPVSPSCTPWTSSSSASCRKVWKTALRVMKPWPNSCVPGQMNISASLPTGTTFPAP